MTSPPQQPPKHLRLVVEKLVPGGEGMARHGGKVVFIPGVLPGEEIRAVLVEERKDFSRAELVEVTAASPARIAPPCPVAGRCGGCDWQHMDYAEQARQKLALVEDALRRVGGGLAYPGLEIETGEPWRYRNRMQFHRSPAGEAGFLARASHAVVPVKTCPVAHPAFDALLAAPPGPDTEEAGRFPAWAGPESGTAVSGENGMDPITVDLLGRTLTFDLRCFFQSNVSMLEKLIPYALQGLEGDEAMDLFCGVGVFGAFLAQRFRRITAVEENAAALAYARENIGPGNPAHPHRFLAAQVEDLGNAEWTGAPPSAVVVDPPRTGLPSPARDFLAGLRPAALVYVSCHPVTLARDLKDLLARGFSLQRLRLFDFYPQTSHVEAVAHLQWTGKPPPF